MSDAVLLGLLLTATGISSFGLVAMFSRHRSAWPRWMVVLLAALPVPGLLGLFAASLVALAWLNEKLRPERCGVDACGMLGMFGLLGLLLALTVYLFGLLCATIGIVVMMRKPLDSGHEGLSK